MWKTLHFTSLHFTSLSTNCVGKAKSRSNSGFTLIELSIVLVIIGLVVGGVLVGRDLIDAASVRSQISQMEKYQTAVRTFQLKYDYLPGDIPDPYASQFGFIARGSGAGYGDGNGFIQSTALDGRQNGEPVIFWRDLSEANLINEKLTTATFAGGTVTLTSSPGLYDWYPVAKIGQGNFIMVYYVQDSTDDGVHYYVISALSMAGGANYASSNPGLTPLQAFKIDQKLDDGLPQSGSIKAKYLNYNVATCTDIWASGGGVKGAGIVVSDPLNPFCFNYLPSTAATPATSITCYDNGNTIGTTQHYSLTTNNLNCALSFKFK